MMLEEYLDGTEVDIDVVMTGGQPAYCVVTDNWPTLEPWFNETGDNAPSLMPSLQQKELQKLAVGTLRALGLKMGVFHVEAKYTSRGPRLIEVNSRMGGGQVRVGPYSRARVVCVYVFEWADAGERVNSGRLENFCWCRCNRSPSWRVALCLRMSVC